MERDYGAVQPHDVLALFYEVIPPRLGNAFFDCKAVVGVIKETAEGRVKLGVGENEPAARA